jgi:hypothetical protein
VTRGSTIALNWIISIIMFVIWLACVLAGKGGFIHILILCAVSIAVVEWAAHRRAAQG